MNDKELLIKLGKCYNIKNFESIIEFFDDNVVYESFDCLYRVSSKDDVAKVMTDSIKSGTSSYEGFFLRKGIIKKHLTQCILICDDSTLKCIRILHLKQKKRIIVNITGYNPEEYNYTRGKKIED